MAEKHERTPLLPPGRREAREQPPGCADPGPDDGRAGRDAGEDGGGGGRSDVDDGCDERTVVAKQPPLGRLALVMGTAWLGVFLGAADSTIMATLSSPIASEFGSLSLLSWLATAYLVSNAACQPVSGRLTDVLGRRPGLVFRNLVFAAGNLVCGLARGQPAMLLGRIVAGVGGGGLMSISTFLASDLVPLRSRGVAQGIGNVCYGSGAMLGGVLGGLVHDRSAWGWRLAFLVQVPPALLSAAAAAVLVRVPPKQSDRSYLARIDFVGVAFTSSFLVLLLLGLSSGGNLVAWSHPLPLTAVPLSLVVFGLFVWWESRARQPIIPVRLLADRTVLAACLCNLLCSMVVMAGIFYVPLYLQVLGDSATAAGLKILPSPVGVSIFSVGAGCLMRRTGRYVGLGVASLVVMVAGLVLFTLQGRDSPSWLTSVAFFVGGGYGAMLTVTLLACIAAVEHAHQAVITSATCEQPLPSFPLSRFEPRSPLTAPADLSRSLGGTMGVTVGSAVYQNIIKARLWHRFGDYPGAAEEIRRIRNDLGELRRLPAGWQDGVIESLMEAFRGVWLTLLALALLALGCAALMRHHTLHTTLERR